MSEELQNQQVEETQTQASDEAVNNTEQPKTYTQDEINKIIAERVARVNKKFEGFDELKTKASEYERLLEEKRLSELSEKERLAEIAKKHETEKQTLAQQLEKLNAEVKNERIRNEFIKLATGAKIEYIDDAMKLADLSAVEIGEDGKPVGVDAIIAQLVQDKPFLIGTKTEPKQIGNASNPNLNANTKTKEQALQEAADKARKSGRIEDMQAYAALKMELGL